MSNSRNWAMARRRYDQLCDPAGLTADGSSDVGSKIDSDVSSSGKQTQTGNSTYGTKIGVGVGRINWIKSNKPLLPSSGITQPSSDED